ncbi:YcxB family protein [Clostridium sp. CCUG 7971]|uniref:YcxB family protein n=1 Tax=Clostridium sp. CCUG 7971 TaxID=2811414 RepID=UPI001ABB98D3|nr:YcxB family protein [Clostridium sp. CCUG 7971]MBO3444734.1 YcxB family protein [Clostridium sp. CCUG 7971]
MKFDFEITEDDYIKFNLYHIENSPAHKKTFYLLRYLVPVIFSIPIYFISHNLFRQPSFYWIIISILFVIVWIVTYPKQYKNLLKKEIKKLLNEGDNSSIFGKKTLEIDLDNIKVFGEFSSETILKSSIKNVKVYEDMILIYISGFIAEIVPTRYLDKDLKNKILIELREYVDGI